MLTIHTLDRLASLGEFDRVLNLVLRNGRETPLAARLRLSEGEALPGASLGLALVRSVELARSVDGAPARLAAILLERKNEHGGFGGVVGTAAAVAGLLHLLEGADGGGLTLDSELERRAYAGVRAGLRWLGSRQSTGEPTLFEREECEEEGVRTVGSEDEGFGLIGDGLDSAIVLWLLAGHEREAAEEIRVNDLFAACAKEGRRDADVRRMLALAGTEERPVGAGRSGGFSLVASAA